MKKWIALLLAAVMLMGTAAMAQEDPSAELSALTLQVKQLLEIPDVYDDFYGDYARENGKTIWNLSWQSAERNLWLTCDDQGKIYSYNRYEEAWYGDWIGQYEPRLPKNSPDAAQAAAEAFLSKVLDENESYVFTSRHAENSAEACYFYGYLVRNGINTEIQFSMDVRMDDLQIASFSRSDGYMFMIQLDEDTPQVDAETAAALLAENYRVELRYVADGEQGVRLVYMAVPNGGLLVDALTGDVIRRDQEVAYNALGMGAGAAEEAVAQDNGLTQAELEGIAQMEGVQSEEALDAAARAMTELGLTEEYTLVRSSFSVEEGRVYAQLRYETGSEEVTGRYIHLDARDLTLIDAWTSHPYHGTIDYTGDFDKAQAAAEKFVAARFPEKAGQYELSYTYVPEDPWTPVTSVYFVRVENGVRYEGNAIQVDVDTQNGVIDAVNVSWTEDLTFLAADKAADEEAAMKAFFDLHQPELVYAHIYSPDEDVWTEKLCYRLGEMGQLSMLTAETLEPVVDGEETGGIAYEDAETAGETALQLAEYGIGYMDGSFRGQDEAALRDVLVLLLTADGLYQADMDDARIILTAQNAGLLSRGEHDPDAPVTRAWLAKTLVSASGYGKAAHMTDIYRVGFADADQVSSQDTGYIAIARGMGIAVADGSGCFHPNRNITRSEALEMLYAFLNR